MRILLYTPNFFPEKTGNGKYTGELAAWLASRGHNVRAIVGPPHYPEWKVHEGYSGHRHSDEVWQGVRVHRVPMYVPPAGEVSTKRRIRMEMSFSMHSLRPWLRAAFGRGGRPDVVIAVAPPMQVATLPRWMHALRRVPWVYHIQDLQVDAAFRLGMLKGGAAEKVLLRIENRLLRKATRVSTITEAMRRRIVAKGVPPERTWLVPNWTDLSFVTPGSRENAFRREVGAEPDQTLFVYSGNMGKKQGLDVIVRAADLLRDVSAIRIVIGGSGADEARIKGLAADLHLPNLTFVALQPVERLPELLAAADVHLVVQKREAADLVMPSKLTNILAAGRPSIATADEGTTLHLVLTEHDAGVCVPVDDAAALAAAMRALASDAQGRARMGANARAYAEKNLDKQTILRDFEAQLESLVAESKAK